jgi:DNA polymerase kappa
MPGPFIPGDFAGRDRQSYHAGFIAKKLCPELILVKMHVGRYIEMSRRVMDVFRRYDPNMAAAGVDEGYLK